MKEYGHYELNRFGLEKECSSLIVKDNGKNITVVECVSLLNWQDITIKKLKKENEQLKFQLQSTCDQRDEFYHGARENANRVGKLKKENGKLKQEIKVLRNYGAELLEYINSPPKHRKSIWDAVVCFKNKKGDDLND